MVDGESELDKGPPAEVAWATDDAVAEQTQHVDKTAAAQAKEEGAPAQADQGDDGAESSAEDLQDASDHPSEVAEKNAEIDGTLQVEVAPAIDGTAAEDSYSEQGDDAADLGTEKLQAASDDAADAVDLGAKGLQDADARSEPGDQEPGGAMKCAYCTMDIESGEQYEMIDGRPYHRNLCIKHAKPVAIAAE